VIAVPFDTLKLAKRLKDSGFTQKQASGAAEGLAEVLAESYSSKNATTEAVETLGRAIEQRFTAADRRFEAIDKRLDAIDRRFTAVDERFDAIDRRFVAVDERFDAIDRRFVAIDERFDAMDRRFVALEQGQAELRDSVTRMEAMLAKILDGQAILHQNDMELKRRLDQLK
jgi:chromosome segregation ATPase